MDATDKNAEYKEQWQRLVVGGADMSRGEAYENGRWEIEVYIKVALKSAEEIDDFLARYCPKCGRATGDHGRHSKDA